MFTIISSRILALTVVGSSEVLGILESNTVELGYNVIERTE